MASVPAVVAASNPGPFNAVPNQFIEASAAAPFTINLPSPGSPGDRVVVKKVDNSVNAVTISGNGRNVDGAASVQIDTQFVSLSFIRGVSDWWVE